MVLTLRLDTAGHFNIPLQLSANHLQTKLPPNSLIPTIDKPLEGLLTLA